ncbi:MAG: HAMP domain-containing sensor histidine kinase [Betaproteobacteria bacterium]
MPRLLDLSLRHKIPLWGSVLIVIATLAVSVGMMFRVYDDLKSDVIITSEELGKTLAKTLFPTLLHDDLWRSIEIITAPLHANPTENPLEEPSIFVVGPEMKLLVSSAPLTMPLMSDLRELGPDYSQLEKALLASPRDAPHSFEFPGSDLLHVTIPVAEEGRQLGTLVITHSKNVFLPRFFGIALGGMGMGALVLAVLLPINWYWGRRMAQPLVKLADGMNQMVHGVPAELGGDMYAFRDEVGQLFQAYRQASAELHQKATLEQEMLQSERLAAVGRLAAGIAHEINNPLAGMLMALDNLKHPSASELTIDPKLAKTLEFLERGLQHISETVGALLVEARVQMRSLTPHDFDDVRTLIEPQAAKKHLFLEWKITVPDSLDLPAGLVRQTLINLLLNAIEASVDGGTVGLEAIVDNQTLLIHVVNHGDPPSATILDHIFEPFVTGREGGHGLGLWVTYQIVNQLSGHIGVESIEGKVIFRVKLPLKDKK